MKDISMLLLDNNRSKAYLQNFIRYGFKPSFAIVMGDTAKQSGTETVFYNIPGFESSFDSGTSVYETLRVNSIPHVLIEHLDVNTPEVILHVSELKSEFLIYSGPAGVILKEDILNAGQTFIHAHPGLLPGFKGSTTVYYSMLLEKKIGCSVFEMNPEIDGGDILLMKTYPVPKSPIDFDLVVDPLVRAETLLEWLSSDDKSTKKNEKGRTFFIIHPVLKHLARLKNMQ